MEETQSLYAQNLPQAHKSQFTLASEEPPNFEQALAQLRQLSHTIDFAMEQVQQTLQYFTKYTRQED